MQRHMATPVEACVATRLDLSLWKNFAITTSSKTAGGQANWWNAMHSATTFFSHWAQVAPGHKLNHHDPQTSAAMSPCKWIHATLNPCDFLNLERYYKQWRHVKAKTSAFSRPRRLNFVMRGTAEPSWTSTGALPWGIQEWVRHTLLAF